MDGTGLPAPAPLSIALLSHVASARAPTGAERSLGLLAAGLRGRGHRVLVAAPGPWSLSGELTRAGVELWTASTRPCWLTYHGPRPWPVALLKWLAWARPPRGERSLARRLRRWGPDVVHVNCLPHLSGARAGRAAGLPVVWHVREIPSPGPRRRWLARAVRRHATRVVAVSEAVAEWVRADGAASAPSVVPNGVAAPPSDPAEDGGRARDRLDLPRDGVLVGLFGQLVEHKGALAFVEAATRALAEEPALRFAVAGAGPEGFRRRVEDAIAGSGAAARFHLLPAQATADTLLRAADVVALTTSTPDPFPRIVLEAMAHARPVAAFRSGGTPEMVTDGVTGLLVETGDSAGLARAFVRLAREGGLREALGDAGARRAREEFSIERHLDRMENVLRSAVA